MTNEGAVFLIKLMDENMIFTQHSPRLQTPIPAVFLDRDGTINVEKNYLYKIADWQWETKAKEAIKSLNEAGYLVIVISNQAGIARGMYSADDVNKLHDFANAELAKTGAKIDAFYFCPHHPEITGDCECRKPSPNMILQAAQDFNIDLTKSWMVGDKIIDAQAAIGAGLRPVLVRTGHGQKEAEKIPADLLPNLTISDNLWLASLLILKGMRIQD